MAVATSEPIKDRLGSAERTSVILSVANRALCGQRHLEELRFILNAKPGVSDILKGRNVRPRNWKYVEEGHDDDIFGESEDGSNDEHADRPHVRGEPAPPEEPEFFTARNRQAPADRIPFTPEQVAEMNEHREERKYFNERLSALREGRKAYDKISGAATSIITQSVTMEIMKKFTPDELEDIALMWPALDRIISDITAAEGQAVEDLYGIVKQGRDQTITQLDEELIFMESALSKMGRVRSGHQKKKAFTQAVATGQHKEDFRSIMENASSHSDWGRNAVVAQCVTREADLLGDRTLKRGKFSEESEHKREIIRLRKLLMNMQGQHGKRTDIKALAATSPKPAKSGTSARAKEQKPEGRKQREGPCTVPGCKKPNSHTTDRCWTNKVCDNCNETGHISRHCPNMKAAAMETEDCDYCGEPGHTSSFCPQANFAAMLSNMPDDDFDGPDELYQEEDMCALTSKATVKPRPKLRDYVCLDSGAGVTGTSHIDFIEEINPKATPVIVTMANGVQELCHVQGRTGPFNQVILVETLTTDLASVRQLTATGHRCIFEGNTSTIERNGVIVSVGKLRGGQFLHPKVDFMSSWTLAAMVEQGDASEGETDNESDDISDDKGAPKQRITNVEPVTETPIPQLDDTQEVTVTGSPTRAYEAAKQRVMLGHVRQGHTGFNKMYRQAMLQRVDGATYSLDDIKRVGREGFFCHICKLTKMAKLPRYDTTSLRPVPPAGTEWCLDIKEGLPRTVKGETSCLCAVDRGSGATLYFPMKSKDQTLEKMKELCEIVRQNKLVVGAFTGPTQKKHEDLGIQGFQTDGEAVFIAGEVAKFIKIEGYWHKISAPYVHEQNGLIESAIRTDFTAARACLTAARLQKSLWAHALKYVSQTRFVTLGSRHYGRDQTPFETWKGYKPDISYLRPFGAAVYHLKDYPRQKGQHEFDPTSRLGILLNYTDNMKGCYEVCQTFVPFVVKSRSDVVVVEKLGSDDPLRDPALVWEHEGGTYGAPTTMGRTLTLGGPSSPSEVVTIFDKPQQEKMSLNKFGITLGAIMPSSPALDALVGEPQMTLKQAQKSAAKEQLNFALAEEINSLVKIGTFGKVVNRTLLPASAIVVPLSVTCRVAVTKDPGQVKVKSRVVVRGDKIPQWLVGQTFSPVAQGHTTKLLLGLMVQLGWFVMNTDFVLAYLHVVLPAGHYVNVERGLLELIDQDTIPEHLKESMRVESQINPDWKCLTMELVLALYGLPEAARLFNDYVNVNMEKRGYTRSDIDPCLFFKFLGNDFIFVVVHVDDMAAFSNRQDLLDGEYMEDMRSAFRVKDEGALERFIGMDFTRKGDTLEISQERFIEQVAQRFHVTKCAKTPITEAQLANLPKRHEKRGPIDIEIMEKVGCARYLADVTRWDIQFATGRAASDTSGAIADRTLQYIVGSKGHKLVYRRDQSLGSKIQPFGRVDASFKQHPDSDSYYGYAVYLNNCSGAIEVLCKKIKNEVPQSVKDAEHIGAVEVAKTLQRIRYQLKELRLIPQEDDPKNPWMIHSDSQSTIDAVKDIKYRAKSRHMDPKINLLRFWIVKKQLYKMMHIPSESNETDIFTKALGASKVAAFAGVVLGGHD